MSRKSWYRFSEEITLKARITEAIQTSYGPTGTPGLNKTRVYSTAFQALTSRVPLHARFLDLTAFVPGGGG